MKAVQFYEYGGPDVLRIVEVDAPHAGPGEIRIAVRAAGVNPFDWKLRAGYLRDHFPVPFPAGVGSEAAGIVDEVGPGTTGVAIGDAVFGFAQNATAERAVLTSWVQKPEDMPFEVAGGLAAIAETATRILDEINVKTGETLLVAGAGGGVGTAVIQLAHHRGVIVLGTSSAAKHDYLRELGAIPTTYEPGLAQRVSDLAPKGVDAAVDLVGAGVLPELIVIVGDPERVISIADFTAAQHGVRLSTGPSEHPENAFAQVAKLYTEGAFHLRIEQAYPIEQIAEAQMLSATGRVTGKVVVIIPK